MTGENSVFISYRRDNKYTALLVYKSLKEHNFQVFIDVEGLDSGGYARMLLNQIAANAHFVLILTPNALKRCNEPNDWLRREIEYAMEMRRNIVPLMFDGFAFTDNQLYLTGKLALLPEYQGVEVPKSPAYFEYAIELLHKQHLTRALETIVHPIPSEDDTVLRRKIAKADDEPKPNTQQLNSEEFNTRGVMHFQNSNLDAAIRDFSRAIQINQNYVQAYFNRATVCEERQDYAGAIADYSCIIKIAPKHPRAYEMRAAARYILGDFPGAIEDYTEIIRFRPDNPEHYQTRGIVYRDHQDLKGALADFDKAIRLNPGIPAYYINRGICHRLMGMLPEAGSDFTAALRIKWNYGEAFNERGLVSYLRGEMLKAIADFNEFIRFCPNNPDGYLNRARAHERRRNRTSWRLAMEDYQKYLDLGGGERDGTQQDMERKIRDLRRRV
ncbi:MAG TPA: tetratricopeptide repeat protein [Phototrophicaceae bacterium]|jgi:tetratricopeptide (TPR) repeat protein|nr:tetratricopeptide repeat protein [Phototrophicaceae bacterium]